MPSPESDAVAAAPAKKVEGRRIVRFKDILDRWMIMHLIAILFFSLAAGIVFIHTGMLWVQYMNGRTHRSTLGEFYINQESVSFFRGPAAEQCRDDQTQQQLVVNTSLYVW